jgi:hypothetical protein
MTAINAVAHSTGAYLMTDSATYNQEGIVTRFSPKVVTFPHLSLAVAVTGAAVNGEHVARMIREFASYEEVMAGIAEAIREAWECEFFDVGDEEASHLHVTLAGWSQAKKCGEVCFVSTTEQPGYPAFTKSSSNAFLSPDIGEDGWKAIDVRGRDGKLIKCGPDEYLTKIIEYQRTMPWPVPGHAETVKYIVGNSADLTVINAAGITQRVVLRWADKIGEPIDPSAAAAAAAIATPSIPEGLSRLQRERMEKKIRKGTLRAAG